MPFHYLMPSIACHIYTHVPVQLPDSIRTNYPLFSLILCVFLLYIIHYTLSAFYLNLFVADAACLPPSTALGVCVREHVYCVCIGYFWLCQHFTQTDANILTFFHEPSKRAYRHVQRLNIVKHNMTIGGLNTQSWLHLAADTSF